MNEIYDVVVVGAGPVGCVAARFASRGGSKVIILERGSVIGHPVQCGEGLAPDFFEEIEIIESPDWISNKVKGAKLISPSGHVWTIEGQYVSDEVGLVVRRDVFDRMLARMAVDAGAEILLNVCVTGVRRAESGTLEVVCDNGTIKRKLNARVVIAADGFESRVARWMGLPSGLKKTDICSCFEYTLANTEIDDNYCEFYCGSDQAPGGYAWIFPKGKGVSNVGLGLLLDRIENPGDPKRYLDRFIANHPKLRRTAHLKAIAGGVSVSLPMDCTVEDGIIVVGDAARMVDPLTGGGVANGCIAARYAGMTAANAIEKGDTSKEFLIEYDEAWRGRLEEKMCRNYLAKELFLKQSDRVLDNIIHTLGHTKMEEVGTFELIQAISEKYPDIVKEISEHFL